MRTHLLLTALGLALSLSSCYFYKPYPSQPEPLLPVAFNAKNSNDLEVFIKGESWPNKPYVRLSLLNTSRDYRGDNARPVELLDNIKTDAASIGADAVIILDASNDVVVSEWGDDVYSTPRERMMAVAIKYQDNLADAENTLRFITVINPDNQQVIDTFYRDAHGNISHSDNNYRLSRFAGFHLHEFLAESTKDWWVADGTPPGIVQRRYIQNNTTLLTVNMKEGIQNGKRVIVHLTAYNHTSAAYGTIKNMLFTYDAEGRLQSREWENTAGTRYKEDRIWQDGKLQSANCYIEGKNADGTTTRRPYYRLDYHYWTPEAFGDYVGSLQIIDPQGK